jgi:acyl carrier protein
VDEVLAGLAEIVHEVEQVPVDQVLPGMAFRADLGVDSLGMAEICYTAEERFGVFIPDEAARGLKTVGDAVAYIAGQLG